ncbi:nucleotidyltransferase [Vibrio phage 2.275.O._10N.286.54.E11]|nr:nucleotidyltransferase [Vibrio phage 2.275.O._10N.286.54.E11]
MSKEIKNVIVQHYAGSISYGTSLPTSDTDIRGIFCAGEENIRTPFFPIREQTLEDEEDGKLYELSNFLKLYTDGNPNILESLWVDDRHIIEGSEAYDILTEHRQTLLSKKVAFTYSGYAISQLHRIKGHNKYINNPAKETPPRQIDFVKLVHNFTDKKIFKINMEDIQNGYRLIPYGGDLFGVYESPGSQTFDHLFTLNTNCDADLSGFYTKTRTFTDKIAGFITGNPDFGTRKLPLFIVSFNREGYKKSKEHWKSYWSWKRNRNEARRLLEEENGYDTKHAQHLVRLLNMAEEILTDGIVKVFRPDRELLLDIRHGKFSFDELMEMVEGKDEYIRGELYKKSPLPKAPDIKLASKVLIDAQDCFWKEPTKEKRIQKAKDRMFDRHQKEEDRREARFCENMERLQENLKGDDNESE